MARVCMLLNNFELPFGGPELQALNITKRLISQGHEVLFISKGSGQAPKYELFEGIPVYRLNIRGLGSVEALYRLWKLRDEFDIIHVHGVGRLASVAINFGEKYNKKVYVKVTTAGHIFKPAVKGVKGMLKRLSPFGKRKVELLKKADGMIAISSEILSELRANGFSEDKIAFIPNGVNTDRFKPAKSMDDKMQLRRQIGLPLDKKIFIYTGRLTKRKGIDILLKAWNAADISSKAILILIGSGVGLPDGLDSWIHKFLAENKIADSVVCPGHSDNVNEYLSSADIFAFPSHREGLPNSLLEAMASGLLCIATSIGGNTDLVLDGQTGILVAENNVQHWTSAIKSAVSLENSALSKGALSLVKDSFSLDSTVKRLGNLYERGIG